MTIQQRQRLLNDLVVVYKRNFLNESDSAGFDQQSLASAISVQAKKIQHGFKPTGRYCSGLTTAIMKSKMFWPD